MSKSAVLYKRRQRHRAKRKLANKKAVRSHRRIGGRTGAIHSKQTPSSKSLEMKVIIPNKPTFWI